MSKILEYREKYTRIVKPFDNGVGRRERIDWCIENCNHDFKAFVANRKTWTSILIPGDMCQVFYFENEKDALMFKLAN